MSTIEKLPNELVFVRHGESQENFANYSYGRGESMPNAESIFNIPNWKHRLDSFGIEQARLAKLWINKEMGGLAVFNALYVSPYLRARETAVYLSDDRNLRWDIDDRISEKEWGQYAEIPPSYRDEIFPTIKKDVEVSKFWVRPPGGENIPDINLRLNSFLDMVGNKYSGQKVLAVTHRGIMRAVRYGLEQMRPEEYEEMIKDPTQEIKNCSILCYSRVNPLDQNDIRSRMTWRRIVDPTNSEQLLNNKWIEFCSDRTYTNEELRDQLQINYNC